MTAAAWYASPAGDLVPFVVGVPLAWAVWNFLRPFPGRRR